MQARNLFDLCGRVALITGASTQGIGSEAAKFLAENHAKVFLVARREDRLKEIAETIRSFGGEAAYHACDVSSEEACKAAVERCVAQFGRLDILVLAAGISGKSPKTTQEMFDTEVYRQVLGINLDGTFFMVKYSWQECAKNGVGSIIMVDSLAGFKAAGHVPYTASKGAIRAWTKLFAKKLASYQIRVNSIVPGLTDSEMFTRLAWIPCFSSTLRQIGCPHPPWAAGNHWGYGSGNPVFGFGCGKLGNRTLPGH